MLRPGRAVGATYVFDTCLLLGFAAFAEGLDLLQAHYGQSLGWVDAVEVELRALAAASAVAPGPGHSAADQVSYRKQVRVRQAAKAGLAGVAARFGAAVDLGFAAQPRIDALVAILCQLEPPKPLGRGDRGECACVDRAMVLRYGPSLLEPADAAAEAALPVVIVATNDDRARRLASLHGIAVRSAADVLREMVHDRRLD